MRFVIYSCAMEIKLFNFKIFYYGGDYCFQYEQDKILVKEVDFFVLWFKIYIFSLEWYIQLFI